MAAGMKFTGKCFKLILVDIDGYDELRYYLKRIKGFAYGKKKRL